MIAFLWLTIDGKELFQVQALVVFFNLNFDRHFKKTSSLLDQHNHPIIMPF